MAHFYAYAHAGRGPVDYLKFDSEADRDRWVDGGWGRLSVAAEDIPTGLQWDEEEIFFGPDEEPVSIQSASAG